MINFLSVFVTICLVLLTYATQNPLFLVLGVIFNLALLVGVKNDD